MSEPALSTPPGWYGKLPNLGDFASRRLPDDFISGWDDWLQHGLAAARDDPAWLQRYLVAPIVRFWIAPGVLGDGAWAGLVMPSVDRVGRHFPLTVAQPAGALADTLAQRAWFAALDAAARKVLDVQFTVDDFESELAGLPAAEAAANDDDAHLTDTLLRPGSQQSVWWCEDADAARLHVFDALPPPREFALMWGGSA